MKNNLLKKYEYGYFLIWGHGLQHQDDIYNLISENKFIDIIRIKDYSPSNIKKFVKKIYSHDYAPFWHLKAKTNYLMNTPSKVRFIFFRNKNPEIKYFGKGNFRHTECVKIKKIKNLIRDKYNPSVNGKRTEHHVIHASDNESQTSYALKLLGHKEGIEFFEQNAYWPIKIPYYIPEISQFKVIKIKVKSLLATILEGNRQNYTKNIVPLKNTPHFKALNGSNNEYQQYIDEFLGGPLTGNYSLEKFMTLKSNFEYLSNSNSTNYILVKKNCNKYLIQDGLHRASILAHKKVSRILVSLI